MHTGSSAKDCINMNTRSFHSSRPVYYHYIIAADINTTLIVFSVYMGEASVCACVHVQVCVCVFVCMSEVYCQPHRELVSHPGS